ELWARAQGEPGRERAPSMDEALHAERVDRYRRKRTFRARRVDIPSGTFIRYARRGGEQGAFLVVGPNLLTWAPSGYTSLVIPSLINEDVEVLTPPSIVAVLSAGYRPMLHHSAADLLGLNTRGATS